MIIQVSEEKLKRERKTVRYWKNATQNLLKQRDIFCRDRLKLDEVAAICSDIYQELSLLERYYENKKKRLSSMVNRVININKGIGR